MFKKCIIVAIFVITLLNANSDVNVNSKFKKDVDLNINVYKNDPSDTNINSLSHNTFSQIDRDIKSKYMLTGSINKNEPKQISIPCTISDGYVFVNILNLQVYQKNIQNLPGTKFDIMGKIAYIDKFETLKRLLDKYDEYYNNSWVSNQNKTYKTYKI